MADSLKADTTTPLSDRDIESITLEPEQYPSGIQTPDQRRRWELAHALAQEIYGDLGPQHTWPATRAIYNGPWPT